MARNASKSFIRESRLLLTAIMCRAWTGEEVAESRNICSSWSRRAVDPQLLTMARLRMLVRLGRWGTRGLPWIGTRTTQMLQLVAVSMGAPKGRFYALATSPWSSSRRWLVAAAPPSRTASRCAAQYWAVKFALRSSLLKARVTLPRTAEAGCKKAERSHF